MSQWRGEASPGRDERVGRDSGSALLSGDEVEYLLSLARLVTRDASYYEAAGEGGHVGQLGRQKESTRLSSEGRRTAEAIAPTELNSSFSPAKETKKKKGESERKETAQQAELRSQMSAQVRRVPIGQAKRAPRAAVGSSFLPSHITLPASTSFLLKRKCFLLPLARLGLSRDPHS